MKHNHFIIAFGIAIPLIVVMTIVILLQNNKNIVKTNYDLVLTVSKYSNYRDGECLHEKFSIDNTRIKKDTQNMCSRQTLTNELVISDELYILNTDSGTYKKTTFEELSNRDIYTGLKSPDGISYGSSSRYYNNSIGYILDISYRNNNQQFWTINLEKGVWTRKIEIEAIYNNNNYYSNPGILGWIER